MTNLRKAAEELIKEWDWECGEYQNKALTELIEALRQALAQPEQEPVAWVDITDEGKWSVRFAVPVLSLPDGTKFYTAPPKREWVWLTVEEMLDCWEQTYEPGHREYVNAMNMSRAVQVKSKEKNT